MDKNFKPRIRVRHGFTARYVVESKTTKGIGHQVDLVTKTCGCKAGQNGLMCWHGAYAAQYHTWRKQQGLVA